MRRTARDYETDYTRCRLRTRGRSVRFGPFRDLPRQYCCHRVAAGCRVPVGVVRYLVAATAWNLRLHSFGVSPQSPLAGSQQSIGPGVLTL